MSKAYTEEQLKEFGKQHLISIILGMQEQMNRMNDNLERLIEQIAVANQNQFGRKTEKLNQIDGQLSFFNEAEALSDDNADEPEIEIVVRKVRNKKQAGKRELDLEGLPEEQIDHTLSDEQLDSFFGPGCWRRMKSDMM